MSVLHDISEALQLGSAKKVKFLVQQALDEGYAPTAILSDGLLAGMDVVGEKFKRDEIFVPEVLVSARAMKTSMAILEPHLKEAGDLTIGKAVVGTVQGDLHDIGKNLVCIMLRCAGFEVIDLGVDVPCETFVEKAEEVGADLICLSALLTTTMQLMQDTVHMLQERGVREKYIVMVGGAPVNEHFAKEIAVDYYTPDAATCAQVARAAVLARKGKL